MTLEGGSIGGARKRMYKKDQCSPKDSNVPGTCLDDDIIIDIAKQLNSMENKNLNKIDLKSGLEDIHGDVCSNISKISDCSSEACWQTIKSLMKGLGSKKEQFKESFKPFMPDSWVKDYNEWLSTTDIEDCLEQYAEANDDFHFYGAVPIDFKKCAVSDLCSFNLKDHLKKHKKVGIVFNTDPSTEDGKHWISMYVDLLGQNMNSNPGIYYFDSFGHKPPKEIKDLIDKIKKQGKDVDKEFLYFYNDHPYQKQDSQCGVFSIHFIKSMLDGLSFEKYLKTPLSDKKMIELRSHYFIKPEK